MKKMMKVLIVAIAVMSLPIAFSQRVFCQGPEVDSVSTGELDEGSSGTLTIYGDNLSNSDGSCGGVGWWSYIYPYSYVGLSVDSCDPGGTWITVDYSVDYIYIDGQYWDDLGTVEVSTDGGDSGGSGPDIDVDY